MANLTTAIERVQADWETGGEIVELECGLIRNHMSDDRETVAFRRATEHGRRSEWAIDVYLDDEGFRTPAEARRLAAALLEAADEVERRNG